MAWGDLGIKKYTYKNQKDLYKPKDTGPAKKSMYTYNSASPAQPTVTEPTVTPNTILGPQTSQQPQPQQEQYNVFNDLKAKQGTGAFAGGNTLSNVDPALQNQINQNLLGYASGTMGQAQKDLSNQSFAAQAKNMRAQGGAFNAPNIGQGAANRNQQAIEQGIMSQLSNKNLQDRVFDEDLRKFGTQAGIGLAQQNEQSKQFGQNLEQNYSQMALTEKLTADQNYLQQQGVDMQKAGLYGYTDAQGNKIPGTLEIQGTQHKAMLSSQAGQSFANYITANKSSDINDPAVQKMGQALWESTGNTGPAPGWWTEQRIAAIRDPELTNPILGTQSMLQEAVNAGAISKEQFDGFMGEFTKGMLEISGTTTNADGTPQVDPQISVDTVVEKLPEKFQNISMDPKTWEDIGKPGAKELEKWYKQGGENYINMRDSIPMMKESLGDLKDWKEGKGKYTAYGPVSSYTNDDYARIRAKISNGIGEKAFEDQMLYSMATIGKYSSHPVNIPADAKAKMVEDGYTEKQINDMVDFNNMVGASTKARYAFGYTIKPNYKNNSFKLEKRTI